MSDTTTQERIISLDAFRGMTIAAMVLVNNPGTWSAIYGPLRHAEWHGITPTDYIFPFFLFIVGVAIPVAFTKRLAETTKRALYRKIVFRFAAIFASGLAISAVPLFVINETAIPWPLKWLAVLAIVAALYFLYVRKFLIAFILIGVWALIVLGFYFGGWDVTPYNFAGMRIFGVLQRIAVCYLVASIIFLNFGWKAQVVITAVLLLAYWALMTLVPVPGCDVTTINDKACNLAAWLDRTILTENHIWRAGKVYDPEGILSTMPAIATTLIGVLTGKWLLQKEKGERIREKGEEAVTEKVRRSTRQHIRSNRDILHCEKPPGFSLRERPCLRWVGRGVSRFR
jgi:predicted acyltransferase